MKKVKITITSFVHKLWREWILPLLVVAAIIFPFKSAIAEWNYVPTGSMKPTILEGDFVFVNKLAYDLKIPFTTVHIAEWAHPKRGDIVVCFSPEDGKRLIKRVIGVPGDQLELRNNQLYVNGDQAELSQGDSLGISYFPRAEREHRLFVLESVKDHSRNIMITPSFPGSRSFSHLQVPKGHYFLMGDNRDNSRDSRAFGFVERDQIVGRARSIFASVDPQNSYGPRWKRVFTSLDDN